MRKKIILMTGGTETLDFFSRQLASAFQNMGFQTFLFDQTCEEESAEALSHFAGFSDSILITFNFEGLNDAAALYDGFGRLFWDVRNIPCINIAVDHPFYYPELWNLPKEKFYAVSIDGGHRRYLDKYYPEINNSLFLPLAGTSLTPDGNYKPLTQRTYDVVFTGNFAPKETFLCHMNRLGKEYAAFYQEILTELIANPDLPDDIVMERHLLREFPDASSEVLRQTMGNMIFIDAYIRFYFREKVVQTLVDSGIHVHCIGHGWDKLSCEHPEYLTHEKNTDSFHCLERMADARISLNVMPWFKEGAHDRVFNSMANGSVCVTDHSNYLDKILADGENAVFYDLKDLNALPPKIDALLKNPEEMEEMAANGYRFTIKEHIWYARAKTLQEELFSKLH